MVWLSLKLLFSFSSSTYFQTPKPRSLYHPSNFLNSHSQPNSEGTKLHTYFHIVRSTVFQLSFLPPPLAAVLSRCPPCLPLGKTGASGWERSQYFSVPPPAHHTILPSSILSWSKTFPFFCSRLVLLRGCGLPPPVSGPCFSLPVLLLSSQHRLYQWDLRICFHLFPDCTTFFLLSLSLLSHLLLFSFPLFNLASVSDSQFLLLSTGASSLSD